MSNIFSVIIPAYNVEKHIEDTLASVWAQRFRDFEVIVVDDGSTDATSALLSQQTDPRLTVVRIPNQGVSHARNEGIIRAKGDYIAFLDGDDIWFPDHLEKAHAFFSAHPHIHWYAGKYVADVTIPKRTNDDENLFTVLNFFRSGYLRTWTSSVILKKNALPEGDLFPEELHQAEDIVAWMRFAERNPELGYGSVVTAFYRQRPSSQTHSVNMAMEAVIDYERRFYHAFAGLSPQERGNRFRFQWRKYEIFSSSFSYILNHASLASFLPLLKEYRHECGVFLTIYMGSVVLLLRVVSAMARFPLNLYIRLYRKMVSLHQR